MLSEKRSDTTWDKTNDIVRLRDFVKHLKVGRKTYKFCVKVVSYLAYCATSFHGGLFPNNVQVSIGDPLRRARATMKGGV